MCFVKILISIIRARCIKSKTEFHFRELCNLSNHSKEKDIKYIWATVLVKWILIMFIILPDTLYNGIW